VEVKESTGRGKRGAETISVRPRQSASLTRESILREKTRGNKIGRKRGRRESGSDGKGAIRGAEDSRRDLTRKYSLNKGKGLWSDPRKNPKDKGGL